jgi:membrane-associated phospholipid phosphatase
MLFLNKDHSRLLMGRVWASLILVLLLCLACMVYIDRQVLLLVHNELPVRWQIFFNKITQLGEGYIWLTGSAVAAVGGYLLQRQGKTSELQQLGNSLYNKGLFVFLSIIFSGVLLNIIKTMIGRLRPRFFLADATYGFQPFNFDFGMNSFPSGHSQTIWALMTALSLLYPRFTIPFVSFATLVAASRVLVAAHYVSDVMMGSYLGIILTLYLYTWFVRKGYLPRKQHSVSPW